MEVSLLYFYCTLCRDVHSSKSNVNGKGLI